MKAAPKNIAAEKTMAPQKAAGPMLRVPLENISLGPDSGFRRAKEERKAYLRKEYRCGNMGQTALSQEALLLKTDQDGNYLIDDGRCSIEVLVEDKALYMESIANTEDGDCSHGKDDGVVVCVEEIIIWPRNMVDVFEHGLFVTWHEYEDDSLHVRKLWNASKHDVSNNSYDKSSVLLLVDAAQQYVHLFKDNAKK